MHRVEFYELEMKLVNLFLQIITPSRSSARFGLRGLFYDISTRSLAGCFAGLTGISLLKIFVLEEPAWDKCKIFTSFDYPTWN